MQKYDVVLLHSPFFRFCGSHNDRLLPSLAYLSRFLEEKGVSHVIYNADYTGASTYWRWRWMFENFDSFIEAVDNKGSLYGEVIEKIMSFSPKVVVIAGGEILFPTTDLGNPYIASNFSTRLRKFGIFTVGMGPFFTVQPEKFKDFFDCLIIGEPSEDVAQAIKGKVPGIIRSKGLPNNILPNLNYLYPPDQTKDYLLTSFGCAGNCSFCPVPKIRPAIRYIEPNIVVQDLLQRPEKKIYLADLNFTFNKEHIKNLRDAISRHNIKKEFAVDSRVDTLDEEKLKLMKEMGVTVVKIGIEGMTEKQLKIFNKKITKNDTLTAIELLKKYQMKVVGYFIIGGPGISIEDYKITIEWIKKLRLDYLVINIWSYDFSTDFRYDTHFSPLALKRWNIPKEIFYQYLETQQALNPTVGDLIG